MLKKKRVKLLCTFRERKSQLGSQSKQGVTVGRKNSPEGRNLEQIQVSEWEVGQSGLCN